MPCTGMEPDLARSRHRERWGKLHRPDSATGEHAMHRKHSQPTGQIQVFETSRAIKKILNATPEKQAEVTAASGSAEAGGSLELPPKRCIYAGAVELVRGQSKSPG